MTLTRMDGPREILFRRTWPDFAFTEEQWSEIAKLGDIPSLSANEGLNYRRMMEVTIGLYQRRKRLRAESKRLRAEGGAMLPGEARKELASIQRAIWNVQERLWRLKERQPLGWDMSFGEVIKTLRQQELELYLLWENIKDEQAKRPEQDVYYLVGVLDGIWMKFHEGEMISWSRKSSNRSRAFVEAVLHIADPDIGPGTITRAIKRAWWRDRHVGLTAHFAAK
jgi:hypothetical protein